jgi:hypothetical protein
LSEMLVSDNTINYRWHQHQIGQDSILHVFWNPIWL